MLLRKIVCKAHADFGLLQATCEHLSKNASRPTGHTQVRNGNTSLTLSLDKP